MKKVLLCLLFVLAITFAPIINVSAYEGIVTDTNNGERGNEDDLPGYYHIGAFLTVDPVYETYNMQTDLRPGDIIYEVASTSSLIHHIAIVHSIVYDSVKNIYYVKTIEATSWEVDYCLFDEYRMSEKEGIIYRVNNLTDAQINAIIYFCEQQLYKDYSIRANRHASIGSDEWYCSELCWAAYYYAGINLDGSTSGIVYPSSIASSSYVTQVQLTSHAHNNSDGYVNYSSLQHYYYCKYCGNRIFSQHLFRNYLNYKECILCGYRKYDSGQEQY